MTSMRVHAVVVDTHPIEELDVDNLPYNTAIALTRARSVGTTYSHEIRGNYPMERVR